MHDERIEDDDARRRRLTRERVRKLRARRAAGEDLVSLKLNETAVRALVRQGWLAAHDADDREATGRALAALLDHALYIGVRPPPPRSPFRL